MLNHVEAARAASLLSLLCLFAAAGVGCGKKAADTNTPYATTRNPAAVAPVPPAAGAAGARGGPPEADAYRQKMGPNAKPPGAR